MTPEMMLQLVLEGEFDPDEVEQIAGCDIGYSGSDPITAQADDGTRLLLEPKGRCSPRDHQQWIVYFVRRVGAVEDALHIAGELWRYGNWAPGHWSAHPNPTFYFGPSWGGFNIKASSVVDAGRKLYNILKASPRRGMPR